MRLLPLLSLSLLVPVAASAQATVRTNAQLRATPNGVLIATLHEGATLERGKTSGGWTRVTLEGYVYKTGIGGKRDTFRISAASDGVLLRESASPKGKQLASMREGMGLVRVGSRGDWLKVRRTAWVKSSLLEKESSTTVARAKRDSKGDAKSEAKSDAKARPSAGETPSSGSGAAAVSGSADATTTSHGDIADASDSLVAKSDAAQTMVTHGTTELRLAPEGKRVAALDSSASVAVLGRERGWTLVRVEGWVPDSVLVPEAGTMLTSISAADLRAQPERYDGQTVRWEVQKIALQKADPLRKGLAPDEPYLLARGPGDEHSLLYLAIPPSLLDQARRVEPLARIVVTARVRAGRSEPSGVPLLDVMSIAER
ncbi:MAG TPA: hypothetical protein VFK04_17875 [Gemmatimonadaceae bacterium]|nr:hypothetical protein [Gemmatimonadaceae bacterium]